MKLYNGDCLDIMYKSIKDGIKVDAIVTDPPYGVNFKGGNFNDNENYVFDNAKKWLDKMFCLLNTNSYLVLFVGVKHIHKWIAYAEEVGFNYKNIVATMSFNNGAKKANNNFGSQFQPILIFSKGNGKDFNKVNFIPTSETWYKDKRNKNPKKYTYEYPNWIKTEWCFATEKRSTKNFHPNEKNVRLLSFFIKLLTENNDLILYPFMGSGTTGIACKNTKRDFIGVELDKNYFNIAEQRIKN